MYNRAAQLRQATVAGRGRVEAATATVDPLKITLRQQQNAVMLWQLHPSDTDISTITGCLKS